MKATVAGSGSTAEASSRSTRPNWSYLLPACLVVTLGGFLFGYDTGVISGAIEPLTARFELSEFMKGWASGSVLLGCACGVLLVGPLSDSWGRKAALGAAAAMFLVSAVGTALASNVVVFVAFRILSGLGIGMASISTPIYIAEISPAALRGRMVAINQIAIVTGIAATAFINYAIAHAHGDPAAPAIQSWITVSGWRWMFAAGTAPALLFAVLLLPVPESPRWLLERKRDAEAKAVLTRVAGADFADREFGEIQGALVQTSGAWSDLFTRDLWRPFLLGIGLAILQQITGINVFLYFGTTIFRNWSASSGVDAGLLQQIVINGAGVLFTLVAVGTVDRLGRRPLMLVGAAGMGLSLVAMGVLAQFSNDAALTSHWMLAFILVYIGSFGLSVGPVTWVILAEIFPTPIRARALGLATFFLWLADYGVTQSFPLLDAKNSWLVRHFQHAFPFYLYAFFCAVLIVVVWRFIPETKGRSLEQIEQSWRR